MSKKFFKWFKGKVMYHSMQERKKREYAIFEKEYMKLKSLRNIEIKAEYINTKSKYEHRKSLLTLFIGATLISIIFNIWKELYIFLKQVMNFVFINQGSDIQIVKAGVIMSVIIIVSISIFIFINLLMFIKETYNIYRTLIMVEAVMNDRDDV